LPAPIVNGGGEIGFENGRNSNFEGLLTLTLTLDPAIRHTVVHHSSTSTYIPNSLKSKKLFVDGRTDGRTYGRTYGRTFFPPLILLGRLLEVDLTRGSTYTRAWSFSQQLFQGCLLKLMADSRHEMLAKCRQSRSMMVTADDTEYVADAPTPTDKKRRSSPVASTRHHRLRTTHILASTASSRICG